MLPRTQKYLLITILLLMGIANVNAQDTSFVRLPDGRKILLLPDNTWEFESQTMRAKTETGKVILLNPDSTWTYSAEAYGDAYSAYFKPPASTKLIKSEWGRYGIWLDEKIWDLSIGGQEKQKNIEFRFEAKDKSVIGVVMFEKKENDLETLLAKSLKNYKKAAPDAKFIAKQMRTVNGSLLMFVEMELTFAGTPVVYFIYYYTGVEGTIQFSVFTQKSTLKECKDKMEDFLNGFVVF